MRDFQPQQKNSISILEIVVGFLSLAALMITLMVAPSWSRPMKVEALTEGVSIRYEWETVIITVTGEGVQKVRITNEVNQQMVARVETLPPGADWKGEVPTEAIAPEVSVEYRIDQGKGTRIRLTPFFASAPIFWKGENK